MTDKLNLNVKKIKVRAEPFPERLYTVCYRVTQTAQRILKSVVPTFKLLWKMQEVVMKSETYVIEGEAKDHEWLLERRPMIESYIFDEMRMDGYLPVLDASPGLAFEYNQENETFNYRVEVLAYKVGPEKAKKWFGIFAKEGVVLSQDQQFASILDEI